MADTPVEIDGSLVNFDPLILKGDPGSSGAQGATGQTGATPAFTMGTVTTVPDGQSASASITGSTSSPVLNLVLPAGPIGPIGPLDGSGTYARIDNTVLGWAIAQSYVVTSVTRDNNEAIVTANVQWPDGTVGIFTTDTASTSFPGAIDAYHVTYGSPVIHTYTQPAVTRDTGGAVTAQPTIAVS